MTRFVDTHALAQLVDTVGIEQFLRGMVNTMSEDFARWDAFEKSARVASHSDVGVIELMPISDGFEYGFKYVNGHPANAAKGISTVMAFGALADVDTGYPKLLSELTITTAFRTAAAALIASRTLARPDARVMGMIGCGAQSEFQAIAYHTQLDIDEIRIYDVDRDAMLKLDRNLKDYPDLQVVLVDSAAEAARGSDIVTTCTADKRWATILTPDMVEPGMHISGLGGDCPGKTEIHEDVVRQAKVFTEYTPQTRIEGDIQQLPDDFPVTELGDVLGGRASGRDDDEQVTFFDGVGFAMEDYSALRYVFALAENHEVGEVIDLIPDIEDPKDLYSLVGGRKLALKKVVG
ncbi:MAG: ornithine cyclodeaminase [Pseudomonadota bacterium]